MLTLRVADPPSDLRSGQVINLTLVGDGILSCVYTIPIQIGADPDAATYNVQIDTGSADLWVASTGCSSCNKIPSSSLFTVTPSSIDTSKFFSIDYAVGSASGEVYWDTLHLGQYSIGSQAFASASTVSDEQLSEDFVGVLGLAMTPASGIAQLIPPTTDNGSGDVPDGQTVTSNLWGITPNTDAPGHQYMGILLERPDMPNDPNTYIPSQLSIGAHPPFVSQYLSTQFTPPQNFTSMLQSHNTFVTSLNSGDIAYWRSRIDLITIYTPNPVNIDLPSGKNGVFPTAILDTGGSTILTTRDIANAFWGALDIQPASDGMYYIDCKTPVNVTFTLANLPPIPIHPLDMTAETTSANCIGTLQASDVLSADTSPAEIILGVPFLRNVYTVLLRESLDETFLPLPSNNGTAIGDSSEQASVKPSMSIIPLTNITTALQQFHQVRVNKAPLNNPNSNSQDGLKVGKHLPLGIVILLALIGLALFVASMFGVWYVTQKRRMKKMARRQAAGNEGGEKDLIAGAAMGRPHSKAGTMTTSSSWGTGGTFVGADDDERGRKATRESLSNSNKRNRTISQSISGFYRDLEPWEDAGGNDRISGMDFDNTPARSRSPSPMGSNRVVPTEVGELTYPPPTSPASRRTDSGAWSPSVPLLVAVDGRRGSVVDDPDMMIYPPPRLVSPAPPGLNRSDFDDMVRPTSNFSRSYSDDRYPTLAPLHPPLRSHSRDGSNGSLASLRVPAHDNYSSNHDRHTTLPTIAGSGRTTPTEIVPTSMAGIGSGRGRARLSTTEDVLIGLEDPDAPRAV